MFSADAIEDNSFGLNFGIDLEINPQ